MNSFAIGLANVYGMNKQKNMAALGNDRGAGLIAWDNYSAPGKKISCWSRGPVHSIKVFEPDRENYKPNKKN